ncbi:MAG: IS3 family transposase [Flavobacteriales bacterium]|nr:IS3 family transposase [Flavobacteriales bacterium]
MSERLKLTKKGHELSILRQTELLEINRSNLYFKPKGESEENLNLMRKMDELFIEYPTLGVLGMMHELLDHEMKYGPTKIRRLLRKMGIEAISPKRNLSRRGKVKYIRSYLLRGMKIEKRNQVWPIDITYIPMKKGFMYLTAIIDVYSRFIVGWQISDSLEKETQTEVLKAAIERHGEPEIVNSDQGSQYTCEHWLSFLSENDIRVSMNGKGRATDNTFIERWFRTLKQKYIYLHPVDNGVGLYQGVARFVTKYSSRRHQGIEGKKPIVLYQKAA